MKKLQYLDLTPEVLAIFECPKLKSLDSDKSFLVVKCVIAS